VGPSDIFLNVYDESIFVVENTFIYCLKFFGKEFETQAKFQSVTGDTIFSVEMLNIDK